MSWLTVGGGHVRRGDRWLALMGRSRQRGHGGDLQATTRCASGRWRGGLQVASQLGFRGRRGDLLGVGGGESDRRSGAGRQQGLWAGLASALEEVDLAGDGVGQPEVRRSRGRRQRGGDYLYFSSSRCILPTVIMCTSHHHYLYFLE
jgi:hypothetical protein